MKKQYKKFIYELELNYLHNLLDLVDKFISNLEKNEFKNHFCSKYCFIAKKTCLRILGNLNPKNKEICPVYRYRSRDFTNTIEFWRKPKSSRRI